MGSESFLDLVEKAGRGGIGFGLRDFPWKWFVWVECWGLELFMIIGAVVYSNNARIFI